MPLSFLKTALLGGAALGLLPVIIHILSRRRYRVTIWAAMEFLLSAVHQNARRLMLQDILLMVLRVLIIVLLALTLARPVLTGTIFGVRGGSAEVGTTILLDDSYSLGYRTPAGPLFERAKAKALDIIRSLPAGSMASVLTCNEQATVQVQPTFDLALAGEVLTDLKPSWRGSNLVAGLQAAPRLLSRMAKPRRELFLITDGQRRAFPAERERLTEAVAAVTPLAFLYVVPVSGGLAEDVAIDRLELRSDLPTTAEPAAFTATVTNRSPVPQKQVAVDLFVDGVKVDTTEVDLAGGAEAERSQGAVLRARLERAGLHQVEARLQGDRLEADDRRYLALRAYDTLPVLVVDGDPGERLFEGEADYLAFALSPVDSETGEVLGVVRTRVIRPHELPQEKFSTYGAVILANVATPPEPVVGALEEYVRQGGGLFLFLGDQVDLAGYNRDLFKAGEGLLPGELGEPVGSGDPAAEDAFGFSTAGLTHPLLSIFADPASVDLSALKVYRAFPLTVAEGSAGRVLWRYTNGGVALAERPFGRGRVLLLTTTADAEWTNLPHKPAFLPLVHRAVYYLARSGQESWNLAPGEVVSLPVAVGDLEVPAEVGRPGGAADEVKPELTPQGPQLLYPRTAEAGFYEFRRRGEDEPFALYAVNVDTAESDLTAYRASDLEGLFAGAPVRVLPEEASLTQGLRESREGRELWRWFLAAVVGLALVETFLGRAFAPKE
jgi:hypothetical protein